ncbi:MAG: hypothetical protein A2W91_00370 [Bacteroidetes bacterium GWF2_38_335]|nr:MAG: hypothetical protein A2W91_00370 [Bacteroidetes bacterium GWF2_38_335]OFY78287.1 MAG: hypothetical protein A2281_03750 [Bacteroidetes bacterium RIFOXYA12_FULL_38_20]HBS87518.1 hypothetical protein [Bacteroidales bacterium]
MRKIYIFLSFLLVAGIAFGQGNMNKRTVPVEKSKIKSSVEMTPTPGSFHSIPSPKATWDTLFTFTVTAAGQQAVETDGNFIYTTAWGGTGTFYKYDMDGNYVSEFAIAGAGAIRDLTFDGTYFYGSNASMNLYQLDLAAGTLVSTIPATCSGVTGIRHCAYDPTLDGGNGGFWVGNWAELGAISMTGAQLVANVAGNADCYGSTYDGWTDPSNPRLLLFQQGGSGVDIHAFDINTLAFQGIVHDCSADFPTYVSGSSIGGGLAAYEAGGYFIALANVQQDPNLVIAYEIAITADPAAPAAVENLTVVPDVTGLLQYDISWTNPTLDVSGAALVDITQIDFYLDEVLVTGLTYDLGVGAANSFAAQTVATPGFHDFKVICTNGAGAGLPAVVTEWIGLVPPANIAFSNIEDISADMAWTQEGTPDSWDIEILTGGTPATGTPTYNTTSNPYSFTGLTASTEYDVYMRAVYSGGNSVWVGPFTFTTLNCPAAEMCELEFIMTDSYGDGWNGCTVEVMENGASIGIVTLASGTTATQYVPMCSGNTIDFVWHLGTWAEEVSLVVNTPFGIELYSFAAGDASAFTDGATIFTFTSSCEPPACPAPTDLTAANITLTSADLGWTAGGAEATWNIEIGVAGFTPTGTGVATTTNPYAATGLTAGTDYEFYVQADCDADGTSLWTGPFAFSTLCDDISTYPYTQSFEAGVVPATCWTSNDVDGDGFNWAVREAPDFTAQDGTFCAASASWDATAGALNPDNYLITPHFVINADNLELKYWVAAQDPSYAGEHYGIFVSTTGTAPADFTDEVFTETLVDEIWKQITVSLAAYNGQSIYIAFRHYGVSDMFEMKIDLVTVDFASSMNEVKESSIAVYPNPSNGILNIRNAENSTISVINMLGEIVMTTSSNTDVTTLDLSSLISGSYMVKINGQNGSVTKKINLIK